MRDDRARCLLTAGALLALALVVRIVPAWLLQTEVADVAGYHTTAAAVLRGDNVYASQALFPYLPYSQFIQALALSLAGVIHWRFDFLVKLPSIAGDAAAVPLIFAYQLGLGKSRFEAVLWGLAWAMNPVAILIAAFHGNLMSVLPGLLVGALVTAEAAEASSNRNLLLIISSLLIGLAIAMRAFPALLVPVFLVMVCRRRREAALFTGGALLAAALSSLPYMIYARSTFLGEFLSYSGVPDFGWVSVLRAAPLLTSGTRLGTFDSRLIDLTKPLFLLSYLLMLLALPIFRRKALGRALMLAPLLFYATYGGVSAQYLVWMLPLAVAMSDWLALPFTAAGTAALVGFYALYHPDILSGHYAWRVPPGQLTSALYVAGDFALVLLSAAWSLHIVATEIHAWRIRRSFVSRDSATPRRPRAQLRPAYLILVVAAFLPWLVQLQRVGSRAAEAVRTISGG